VDELISIILTTYNREDALDAVLRSLSRQTDTNFEIIVADDGSSAETASVIAAWKPRLNNRLAHVWHPDAGFRAAEIRNRAIAASQGIYCVFLDGDCIVRKDFVAVHRALAEPGWFVCGNRILLSPARTERVLRAHEEPELWSWPTMIGARLRGELNRLMPFLRLPLGPLRKLRSNAWRGARSCNFGAFRADLHRVDGFDAAYEGWGREDSDLFVRLLRAGVRRKDGDFATGVIHLWHPEANRAALPENDRRLQAVIEGMQTRARRGLSAVGAEEAKGVASDPRRR
jgi:glycosyltransferase involved in cell wall biosynthesis